MSSFNEEQKCMFRHHCEFNSTLFTLASLWAQVSTIHDQCIGLNEHFRLACILRRKNSINSRVAVVRLGYDGYICFFDKEVIV